MAYRLTAVWGLIFGLVLGPVAAWAQAVEVTDETAVEETGSKERVGPEAARKYFRGRGEKTTVTGKTEAKSRVLASDGERYLALHIGTFLSENVYKWGNGGNDDPGQLNMGVSYKIGEWTNSMDALFKADITTYDLDEGQAVKLSLVPAITFPDVDSGFPLYFGAGAGLGVFFKQISDESSISFDYTILAGARFFDVFEGVGLLVETGMKNHILLLSDGQFNGVYFVAGALFQF
jgi:hypothetical protein